MLKYELYLGLDVRNPVFRGLQITQAQISLRIRAISAFVIRFLETSICNLALGEISILLLVSVTEETGLNLALLETPEDRVSRVEAQF